MLTLSEISVIDKIAIFFVIIFILAIGIALWRILTDETWPAVLGLFLIIFSLTLIIGLIYGKWTESNSNSISLLTTFYRI